MTIHRTIKTDAEEPIFAFARGVNGLRYYRAKVMAALALREGRISCTDGRSGARDRIAMISTLNPLILDMLEWIAREPRPYSDALDAWRTSCPHLTVWEDAVDRGFVQRVGQASRSTVVVTAAVEKFLRDASRLQHDSAFERSGFRLA